MVASPATAPVDSPVRVVLPVRVCSSAAHPRKPVAAAICVTVKAFAATWFAASAEPALKPNQPNHKMPAPSPTTGTDDG